MVLGGGLLPYAISTHLKTDSSTLQKIPKMEAPSRQNTSVPDKAWKKSKQSDF